MPIYNDLTGRAATHQTLRRRGLIAAAGLAVAGTVIYQQGTGGFTDTFTLSVVADTVGEGLTTGSEVKLHGLAIGRVTALSTVGTNQQTITVALEPAQASALTADTTARFTSSNAFGTSAVELVSGGHGGPLASGQTVHIGAEPPTSVADLLRQGQKLSAVIDSAQFVRLVDVLRRHSDLVEPVAKANLDLAGILANSQTVPFSQSLQQIGDMVSGVNAIVPLFALADPLLDRLNFLAVPGGSEHTNVVLRQISRLLNDGGNILNRNNSWIVPLIAGVMNLAIPAAYAAGSLAPAYDRLSGLLDRTSAAFPVQDGKVRMQLQLILDAMPGLAAALPEPSPAGGGR